MSGDWDTKEDAENAWEENQWNSGCSCHNHPPCDFCVMGYSLDLIDFLDVHGFIELDVPEESAVSAYDRAMKSVI